MKIDLVLLASGNSSRFQGNKLLHPYHGKPMIMHALDQLSYELFDRIIVVTQYAQIQSIVQPYGFETIYNDHPEKGISYSIQLGLHECKNSDGCMFLVADQPGITKASLKRMCKAFSFQHIICASEQGILKNPMLFPQKFYHELEKIKGDQGGKQIAMKHREVCIPIECSTEELMDIDTRDQFSSIRRNES